MVYVGLIQHRFQQTKMKLKVIVYVDIENNQEDAIDDEMIEALSLYLDNLERNENTGMYHNRFKFHFDINQAPKKYT